MPRHQKPHYRGILRKPLKMRRLSEGGLLGTPEHIQRLREKLDTELLVGLGQRMLALFDHYGINSKAEGAGIHLALLLALDHVEGFKLVEDNGENTGRGRPNKWDNIRLAQLWLLVQKTLNRDPEIDLKEACEKISRRSNLGFSGMHYKTLINNYNLASRSNLVTTAQTLPDPLGFIESLLRANASPEK